MTEVVPSSGPGAAPRLHEVFSYSPDTDGFEPLTARDVVLRSARLAAAVRFLGIPDVERDIDRRVSILQRCVNAGAYTPTGVFGVTSRYYGVPTVH